MTPVEVEVRDPKSGAVVKLKVVGVLDVIHESFEEDVAGMIISKATLDEALPFPVPIATYQFRLAEGVDAEQIARDIEATFVENGMETTALVEMIRQAIGVKGGEIMYHLGGRALRCGA